MDKTTSFYKNLQKDLLALLFWVFVLCILRLMFTVYFVDTLPEKNFTDIAYSQFLGLRMSLKTAGIIATIGFLLSTLPTIFCRYFKKIKILWHSAMAVVFSFTFLARFPYYKIFNSTYNEMLINGLHDDWHAIFITCIKEYGIVWRLPLALIIAYILIYIIKKLFKITPILANQYINHRILTPIITIITIPTLCIFIRYGGAFNYAHSIDWKSCARLHHNLLNETILDDGQAFYRVYSMHKLLKKINQIDFDSNELQKKIIIAGGNNNTATLDHAFLQTVQTPYITDTPKHITVIVDESFGNWPFLPDYIPLHLADKTLSLKYNNKGTYIEDMLPHGSGTIGAIIGFISGLPDTGLYINYQPNALKDKYSSGIGYIMKQLGYKTIFWCGGYSSWQNSKKFISAQSFDELHFGDEFAFIKGNAWGCPDEELFNHIAKYTQTHKDEKIFNLVLTISNHPPYSIDVDAKGFDRVKTRSMLPKSVTDDEKTLTELGHFWYADKCIGDFVERYEIIQPKSFFVITGDHSERFSFATEVNTKTRSSIPCIFYGNGISKELPLKPYGCHQQIAGTLAELIGPKGFQYTAFLPNMFHSDFAFNHHLIADTNHINNIDKTNQSQTDKITALKQITAWRVLKGNNIK